MLLESMNPLGFCSNGEKISLFTNHFEVSGSCCHFYRYSVSIKCADGTTVDAEGIKKEIVENMKKEISLSEICFAYDGKSRLYTIEAFPLNGMDFEVVLEDHPWNRGRSPESDRKRARCLKIYAISISFVDKIPIVSKDYGLDSDQLQEAVKVLDLKLQQNATKQGCLLVGEFIYNDDPRKFVKLGGGVNACRGIRSSFRATQNGLSCIMDLSTTFIIQSGPLLDFLLENEHVGHPSEIDWSEAEIKLENLRIEAVNTGIIYRIQGLSEKKCLDQTFSLKVGSGEDNEVEENVYDYFVRIREAPLLCSGDLPCINVGDLYIPIELCKLVPQLYRKEISKHQHAAIADRIWQTPRERLEFLKQALVSNSYNFDLLAPYGVSISQECTRVEGRILQAPKLRVGNEQEISPQNGKWYFNNKQFITPIRIEKWAIVNFSERSDMQEISHNLIRCGQLKGMVIQPPFRIFEENADLRSLSPSARVHNMIELIEAGLPGEPQFLLCILPKRKTSDIYGPWKKRILCELGIVTQCGSPPTVQNDKYYTNFLMKINIKLGGLNSQLATEVSRSIPIVSTVPTLIIGIGISHNSSGLEIPSVAALVSSRGWPSISHYRATVRIQPPDMEVIPSLSEIVGDTEEGILNDFYMSSGKVKPENIIIFRDVVSESQFSQVLNVELDQIMQACKNMKDESWHPKFTLIMAQQKNNRTKFYNPNSPDFNVPPGTVIDDGICHSNNNDFYMCAQGDMNRIRPMHYDDAQELVHYHVHDEIGFNSDHLQELVHSLSYVYQRSASASPVVAPICYAHLAAAQMSEIISFDDMSQLPRLNDKVKNSMFFC